MKRLVLAAAAAVLSACAAQATSLPTAPAVTGAPPPRAPATISITIPAPTHTSSSARRAEYISTATNSMVLLAQGQAPLVIPLTATSPGCSISNGARTCTVAANLPVGTYSVNVSLFASANGSGTPLATTSASQTVQLNATNTLSFTLAAVVSSLNVTITPDSTFTFGTPGTRSVNVSVLDAGGATIVVGTDALVDASGSPVTITLSDGDTSGATSVTPTTVGPGPSTLSYNGGTTNAGYVTATARNAVAVVVGTPRSTTFAVNGSGGTPIATVSRYVSAMDYNTLFQQGQTMGHQGQSGLVILDFGQPWYCDGSGPACGPIGSYGTFLATGANPYETTASIASAAEAFLDGWYSSHHNDPTQSLHLAIGTNNYCRPDSADNPPHHDCARIQFYEHGYTWGQMMRTVRAYIQAQHYDAQEFVAGASDLELGWNTAALTEQWVQGYNAAVAPFTDLPLYDYGDAEGCPTTNASSAGNRSCSVTGFTWTQDDVLMIAFGPNVFPVPEIYCSPGNAEQWYQLSLRSIAIGNGKILFPGTLTEHSAAAQRGYTCNGVTVNAALDGFQQLKSRLHGNAATDVPAMSFATDITYSVGDPSPLARNRSAASVRAAEIVGVKPAGPLVEGWITRLSPDSVARKEAQFRHITDRARR